MIVESTSLEATKDFAKNLVNHIVEKANSGTLRSGVVLLFGQLGAGKTTFVSAFAKEVGAMGDVMSPTFVLQRKLKLSPESPLAPFFEDIVHIDAYRFETPDESKIFELEKVINKPPQKSLYFIEWPEKLGSIIEEAGDHAPYSIKFFHADEKGQEAEQKRIFETDIIN